MVSFFWQKGFYFNGQLFFYSNLVLKSLSDGNFGIGYFFIKFFVNRLELFEDFKFNRNTKNLTPHNKPLYSLSTEVHYLLTHYLVNSFPVLLSVRQQTKFNLFKFYLLRTSRGLSLKFNKPIARPSRSKTFSKSTPKSHLRKRSNTSLWFKILSLFKQPTRPDMLPVLYLFFSKTILTRGFDLLTLTDLYLLNTIYRFTTLCAALPLSKLNNHGLSRLVYSLPTTLLIAQSRVLPKGSFVLFLFKLKGLFDLKILSSFLRKLYRLSKTRPFFSINYGDLFKFRNSFFRASYLSRYRGYLDSPSMLLAKKTYKRSLLRRLFPKTTSDAYTSDRCAGNILSGLARLLRTPKSYTPLSTKLMHLRRFNLKVASIISRRRSLQPELRLKSPHKSGFINLTVGSNNTNTSVSLFLTFTSVYHLRQKALISTPIHGSFAARPSVLSICREHSIKRYSSLSFWTSQLTFLPVFKSISFISSKIREFRLSQSEILASVPLRRRIIQYNLRGIKSFIDSIAGRDFNFKLPIRGLKSNSSFFSSRRALYRFLPNMILDKNSLFFKRAFDRFALTTKVSKRVKTLWVSKITQLSLDPFRREFMILHRKKLRYQKRITRFILRYYRFKVVEFMQNLEFRLVTLLPRILFANSISESHMLMHQGFVFVNGLQVRSTSFEVYFYDIVQLAISYRFLIYMRWCRLTLISKFGKFLFYVRYWRKRSFRPFPKQSSYRIPYWVKHSIMFKETKPLYTEIDFLTFTCLILRTNYFNPLIYNYFSFYQLPLASVRGFNWKSLT